MQYEITNTFKTYLFETMVYYYYFYFPFFLTAAVLLIHMFVTVHHSEADYMLNENVTGFKGRIERDTIVCTTCLL